MGIARRSFSAGRPPLGLDRRGSRDPHSGKKEGEETPEARVLRTPREMPIQELREPLCLVNA